MVCVSVLIPTYNQAEYIIDCIESVLNQTFKDFEIIVIDDGSTDETLELLKKYNKEKVRVFRQEHKGNPSAMNMALSKAKGQFLCWLSSDDVWMKDKLERQMEAFRRNPRLGMVYTDYYEINSEGKIIREVKVPDFSLVSYLTQRYINASSVMFRRECVKVVGKFDEELLCSNDGDFWYRISKHFAVAHIATPLVKYRIHDRALSRNKKRMVKYHTIFLTKHNLPLELGYLRLISDLHLLLYVNLVAKEKLKKQGKKYIVYRMKSFVKCGGLFYFLIFCKRLLQHLLGGPLGSARECRGGQEGLSSLG